MEIRLIDLVEDCCHQQGNVIALLDETTRDSVTYCDLPTKFYRISELLRKSLDYEKSSTNPPFVSIISSRHIGSITALLGVLHARAAFVPIDPSLPEAIQLKIFKHSKSQGLIVDQDNIFKVRRLFYDPSLLPPLIVIDRYGCVKEICNLPNSPHPLHLPSLFSSTSSSSSSNNNSSPLNHGDSSSSTNTTSKRENYCFLLYKNEEIGENANGVLVLNEGIVYLVKHFISYLRLTPEDRILSLMPLSCDASVLEIFLPLVVGGTLVIASAATIEDPKRLMNILDQFKITLFQGTRELLEEMIDFEWKGKRNLQILIATGEENHTLSMKLYSLIQKCRQVYILYGFTGTSIWSSCYWLEDFQVDHSLLTSSVPSRYQNNVQYSFFLIGQPIAGQTFFVLTSSGQPARPGQVGEFYIGGKGIAKGYYCNPALTRKKFVKNFLCEGGNKPGRLYKTGKFCLRVRNSENAWEFVMINGIDQLPNDFLSQTWEWCQFVSADFLNFTQSLLSTSVSAITSPNRRISVAPITNCDFPKGAVSSFASVTSGATDATAPRNSAPSSSTAITTPTSNPPGALTQTTSTASTKSLGRKSRKLSRKGSVVTPAGHYFYCQLDNLVENWEDEKVNQGKDNEEEEEQQQQFSSSRHNEEKSKIN